MGVVADMVGLPTVSGIGHKIKSVNNPDLRVELVKEYVVKNFPSHSLLDYALAVEKVTTAKKDTVCCFLLPLLVFRLLIIPSEFLAYPQRRRLHRRVLRRSPTGQWCFHAGGG